MEPGGRGPGCRRRGPRRGNRNWIRPAAPVLRLRTCQPYPAQTKGKTERMAGDHLHHFFVRCRYFDRWAHRPQLRDILFFLRSVNDISPGLTSQPMGEIALQKLLQLNNVVSI